MKLKWEKDGFGVWKTRISNRVQFYILDSPLIKFRNYPRKKQNKVYMEIGDFTLKSTEAQDDETQAMNHAQQIADAFTEAK